MKSKISFCLLTFIANLNSVPVFAQPSTLIKIYKAYTQEGILNPQIIVAQRYAANCRSQSVANPARPDALRCLTSSLILDPCFKDGDTLACIASPWSNKATVVELASPADKQEKRNEPIHVKLPWALELANGQRCTFLPGASTAVNNKRLNYACTDSHFNIIGSVNQSEPLWKVTVYDLHRKALKEIPVTIAWF